MKLLLALISVSTAVGIAAPAHGEPDGDDAAFLAALRAAGLTYGDPGQAIASARAVCGLMSRGETGLQVVSDVKNQNPGLTMDAAAQFTAIASDVYCPEHLTPKAS